MPYIEIPVSSVIETTYNTEVNTGLFKNREGTWFFHLPFPHDGGQNTAKFERTTYKGVSTIYIEKALKLPLIQIETPDSRVAIADVLEAIDDEATDGHFPVYDYSWINKEDRENGYTIRNMVLKTVEALGALFDTPKGLLTPRGWRIQLEAINYDSE